MKKFEEEENEDFCEEEYFNSSSGPNDTGGPIINNCAGQK